MHICQEKYEEWSKHNQTCRKWWWGLKERTVMSNGRVYGRNKTGLRQTDRFWKRKTLNLGWDTHQYKWLLSKATGEKQTPISKEKIMLKTKSLKKNEWNVANNRRRHTTMGSCFICCYVLHMYTNCVVFTIILISRLLSKMKNISIKMQRNDRWIA